MNSEKRYCQNRVRKRKKTLESSFIEKTNTSVEDERQFKLERFVKDVNKFMEDNGHFSGQKDPSFDIASQTQNGIKRTKPSNLVGRRGLFQNGIQTKFYSRGIFGKEQTARLDGDLQQIISLANKENDQNLYNYKHKVDEPRTNIVSKTKPTVNTQLHSRAYSHCASHQPLPTTDVSMDCGDLLSKQDKSLLLLDKIDAKLYPEFIRIVTLSSIESKSVHFKNQSYVTALKKQLLEIYQHERKENSEEQSCLSEVQRSSVATSPLTEPHPHCSEPHTQCTTDSEQGFEFIHFIPEPLKSTSQFLEETIGPGSSSRTVETLSEPNILLEETSSISRNLIPVQEDVLQRRLEHCEQFQRTVPVTKHFIPLQEGILPSKLEYCEPFHRAPQITRDLIPSQKQLPSAQEYCVQFPRAAPFIRDLIPSQEQLLPSQQEYYEQFHSAPPFTRDLIPTEEEVLPRGIEHSEFFARTSSFPPPYNVMMPFDGGGDCLATTSNSSSNLFLLPQEESPVFQYFPRRMF